MSPDMKYVSEARDDNRVLVWALGMGKLAGDYDLSVYRGHPAAIASLFVSSETGTVTCVFADGSVATISPQHGEGWKFRPNTGDPPAFVSLVEAGRKVLRVNRGGNVSLTDLVDGKDPQMLKGPIPGFVRMSVSGDGRVVASEDSRGVVSLDNEITRQHIASTEGTLYTGSGSDFSADGSEFVCSSNDMSTVLVWTQALGDSFRRVTIHNMGNARVAISPDCRYIAVSEQRSLAEVWELSANGDVKKGHYRLGRDHRVLEGGHLTTAMKFSPDSRELMIGYTDGEVQVWKFLDGKTVDLPNALPR
jgi:WD40 repeat protein